MAMAKDKDSSDPSTSHAYQSSICRVAVAQICLNTGYTGAESAALRALTDIAARYIRLLAGTATSAANSRGRTQSNILDLILALEGAAAYHGFAGASDVKRPLLKSSVLRELRDFVVAVDEIPFPRPIRRQMETDAARMQPTMSFAQAGKESPLPQVPRWLPCFPLGWESGEGSSKVDEKVSKTSTTPVISSGETRRNIMRKRERVMFRLGFGEKRKMVKIRNSFIENDADVEGKRWKIGGEIAMRNCCNGEDSNCKDLYALKTELQGNPSPTPPPGFNSFQSFLNY